MKKDVEIRPATPDDVTGISELIAPFVQSKRLLPRTEQELKDLTRNGFVAVVAGQIVGFSAVDVYSRKLAELVCLAVTDERQREGIGKTLVQLCVDRARSLNVLEIMAISASDAFLKECGFDYSLPDQKRALFHQPLSTNVQATDEK
jgi:amino-acid N-acetyltransferase